MNQRPWLRRAYDRWLQVYDVLVMPTIPFVAKKFPDRRCSVSGKPEYLQYSLNLSSFIS